MMHKRSGQMIFLVATAMVLLLTNACKKIEDPVENTGTPVFSLSGTIDGSPLSITAGQNDYYLFTSYSLDSMVYQFSGTFKRTCTQCKEALHISILNYKTASSVFEFNMDSSFM